MGRHVLSHMPVERVIERVQIAPPPKAQLCLCLLLFRKIVEAARDL